MTYIKPELIPLGYATDAIQSALDKNETPFDHIQNPPVMTPASAYVADE